jgi:hypothetical protein
LSYPYTGLERTDPLQAGVRLLLRLLYVLITINVYNYFPMNDFAKPLPQQHQLPTPTKQKIKNLIRAPGKEVFRGAG